MHQGRRRRAVVEGDDEDSCLLQTCGVKQFRARRISEESLDAEAPHRVDGFDVVVQHDGAEPGQHQKPVHDLSETADAGDDDRLSFVDVIVLARLAIAFHAVLELFVGDEEERRQKHRQRDDQIASLGYPMDENALLRSEGQQDEAEFTGLREAKCEKPFVAALDLEDQRKNVEHDALGRHQHERHQEQLQRLAEQNGEVDAGAHGDEEEPE